MASTAPAQVRPAPTPPQPVLRYPGGKRALVDQIIATFPSEFAHYEERFAGGAAVFFALRARGWTGTAVLTDLNPNLMALYRTIQSDVELLIEWYERVRTAYLAKDHDGRGDFYLRMRAQLATTESDLLRATRILFISAISFNGLYRVNSAGGFNAPWGKDTAQPPEKSDILRAASAALQGVTLRHGSFDAAPVPSGAVVYCDPPYVDGFTTYTKEGFDLDAQQRLAAWAAMVAASGSHVILSNADRQIVRDLYAGWTLTEVQARRSINRDGAGRGPVGELIIHTAPTSA